MRTEKEIIEKINNIDDFFGFMTNDLILFLSFDKAQPFLKEGVTAEEWTPTPRYDEFVLKQIHEYMPFAWEKANNCRGLSAARSIDHMKAWLWLLGEEEDLLEDLKDYELYGKPQLRAICEHFDWEWKQWDNNLWVNDDTEIGPGETPYSAELSWKKK